MPERQIPVSPSPTEMHACSCELAHIMVWPDLAYSLQIASRQNDSLSCQGCASLVQGFVSGGLACMACCFVLHGRSESDSCETASGSYLIWNDHIVAAVQRSMNEQEQINGCFMCWPESVFYSPS